MAINQSFIFFEIFKTIQLFSKFINLMNVPRSNRYKFTPEEDKLLIKLVSMYGTNSWKKIHLRNKKSIQCRERWYQIISPDKSLRRWTFKEDCLLLDLYEEIGPKWKKIAEYFNPLNEVIVKDRYYTLTKFKIRHSSDLYLDKGWSKYTLMNDMLNSNSYETQDDQDIKDNKEEEIEVKSKAKDVDLPFNENITVNDSSMMSISVLLN